MTDVLGDLGAGARFRVDASVRQLGPDIILGGSPLRLLRFRSGTSVAAQLASEASLSASALTPRTLRRLVESGVLHPDPRTLPALSDNRLTVVIPIHNRAELLDRALRALGDRFRVVVVDDASTNPDQLEEVASLHQAEIIHLTVNAGPGGARNAGLARVETEFVAFVDSDVVAAPEGLSILLRHFADPGVAAVAPRVLALATEARGSFVERFEALEPPLDMGALPALVRAATHVSYVPSACLVARTSAVGAGFDPSLRTGEDVDLVWRLGQQGWLIRYEPTVVVHHSSRPQAAAWARQHYGYGLSASGLRSRHGDAVAPARFTPWSGIMVLCVWFAAWTFGRGRGSRGAASAALGVSLGAWAVGIVQTRRALGRVSTAAVGFAGPLTANTVRLSLEQSLSLFQRHWAPISLVAGLFSRRARLLLAASAAIDAALTRPKSTSEFATRLFGESVVRTTYGFGVWHGMLRDRDFRAALPMLTRRWERTPSPGNRNGEVGRSGGMVGLPNWFEMDARAHFEKYLAKGKFPQGARALQLGAYTGDASIWLMENTGLMLTDVDTWEGSQEAAHAKLDWRQIEAAYDRRTIQYRIEIGSANGGSSDPDDGPRIRKVKLPSSTFLRAERGTYSFVYIDAAHDAVSVLSDAMLALPLLTPGSLLVFDDYKWNLGETPLDNPKAGIDKFLEIYGDRFTILQLDTQAWLQFH